MPGRCGEEAQPFSGCTSYVNAKYLTPLGDSDEILALGFRAHMSWRAREDWKVMQSTKKADASAAAMNSTVHDGDDGKKGGGACKGQGKRGRGSQRIGAPPVEKSQRAGSRKGPQAGKQLDLVQRPSLHDPIPSERMPTHATDEPADCGTQMTRWTRFTGSLAMKTRVSLHVCMFVLWAKTFCLLRHLCHEVYRRQSTAPSERQGRDVALSGLLQQMSDNSVSSSQGTWPPVRIWLFRSCREYTTVHTSLTWWGRQADRI